MKKLKLKHTILIIAILSLISIKSSFSAITFVINNNSNDKNKVLFYGFSSPDPILNQQILQIYNKIIFNLNTTNLVQIVDFKPQGENQSQIFFDVESIPNFNQFYKDNFSSVVIAKFSSNSAGDLDLKIRMWDVEDKKQLFGKFYNSSSQNYNRLANAISNEIFKAISGESIGHFDSKILYVGETGPINKRIKKIKMIDFDGENIQTLTNGNELVLTPNFSKNNYEIFYLRYFDKKPQIFSLDLRNMRSQKLGGFRATTFATSPNPVDKNIILLSAIVDGNCDIYELNIAGNYAKRLTNSPAIDTTASYSPDGKQIVFSSDRQSNQQIYVMNSDGSNIVKISQGGGSYSKPSWSSDGKLIAFTKIKSNQFMIGTMSPSGKNEKIHTTAYLVEGARWSASSRYLIYSKKKGPYGQDSIPRLYTIDIITGHEYEIPTPKLEGASDPDWNQET